MLGFTVRRGFPCLMLFASLLLGGNVVAGFPSGSHSCPLPLPSPASDNLRLHHRVLSTAEIAGLTPQLKRRYTYGHDLISQTQLPSTLNPQPSTTYHGYDGHGSVRMLLSSASGASTQITDTYDYDAYGQLLNLEYTGAQPTVNHYRYTGERWDNDLGMYYPRARYLNPNTGRFWTMDSYEGNSQDPLTLHKYLYCHGNPVNGTDPSGHENLSSLVVTMGKIGYLAGRTYGAINNAYWMGLARLTPAIEGALHKYFWAEIIAAYAGAALMIAPEALNLAADLGTRINRAYTLNTTSIPPGWGAPNGYGTVIENIGGQQLEGMGGKYLGGNVKGIDGTLGVGQGNVLVSFKAHDVADDRLIETIRRDMRNLQALEPETIRGTTVNGKPFQFEGAASGRVTVIAVPQNQARYIISPQFIEAMRKLAEETKTIPIVRAVRNWPGRPK